MNRAAEVATPEAAPLFEGAQHCACGWLLPRASMVFVNINTEQDAGDYAVDLVMHCPQCGKSFELNDIELLVTQ